MAKIEFLGPIGKEDMVLDVKDLHELKEVLSKDESLKEWLNISSVAVNEKIVSSLDFKLNKEDKVSILPPVCGG